jgi:hypothetical protein
MLIHINLTLTQLIGQAIGSCDCKTNQQYSYKYELLITQLLSFLYVVAF